MITNINFKNEISLDTPSTSRQRKRKVLANNKRVAKKKLKEMNIPEGSTFDFTVTTEESINEIVIDNYAQNFSVTV